MSHLTPPVAPCPAAALQRARRRPFARMAPLAALAAAALAACGGGGDDGAGLSNADAQGYAADAATMPVSASTALDASSKTLKSAVAAGASAAQKAAAEGAAVQPLATSPTTTVPCALGGNVSWTASGLPLPQLLNGQLDAGETYEVSFNNCATVITGVVLSGSARIVVTSADSTGSDITTTATALTSTTPNGQYVLDGTVRQVIGSTATGSGGTQFSNRVITQRLALASRITTASGTRQASYELRNMDWTSTTLFNANDQVQSRTHQGTLELFASTPRRPSATLQVATVGTLVVGSDGFATSGGFSLAFGGDKWTVTYAATTITIALDIGNNGSVDRTWTLARLAFHGDAG